MEVKVRKGKRKIDARKQIRVKEMIRCKERKFKIRKRWREKYIR